MIAWIVLCLLPALAEAASIEKFIVSEPRTVEAMLNAARVGPSDTLYDLGSGDGRIVIAAAKRGATTIGIEIDKTLADFSRKKIKAANLQESAKIINADLFTVNLSLATVVVVFMGRESLALLRAKLERELKPGAIVVSNGAPIGDWSPRGGMKIIDIGQQLCGGNKCEPAPLVVYQK